MLYKTDKPGVMISEFWAEHVRLHCAGCGYVRWIDPLVGFCSAQCQRANPNADLGLPDPELARGEEHHKAKLTESIVFQCRVRHAQGERLATLAREVGVVRSALHAAVTGKSWKHVPMPTKDEIDSALPNVDRDQITERVL
jgi:hypothetical protein